MGYIVCMIRPLVRLSFASLSVDEPCEREPCAHAYLYVHVYVKYGIGMYRACLSKLTEELSLMLSILLGARVAEI